MARREREERPLPAHPYRDTAIVYGIMAVILVVLAGVTGGSLVRAIGAGTIFWLVATAWSWWKFRGRIRERDAAEAVAARGPAPEAGSGASEGGETAGGRTGATNGSVSGAVNGNGSGRGTGSGSAGS